MYFAYYMCFWIGHCLRCISGLWTVLLVFLFYELSFLYSWIVDCRSSITRLWIVLVRFLFCALSYCALVYIIESSHNCPETARTIIQLGEICRDARTFIQPVVFYYIVHQYYISLWERDFYAAFLLSLGIHLDP